VFMKLAMSASEEHPRALWAGLVLASCLMIVACEEPADTAQNAPEPERPLAEVNLISFESVYELSLDRADEATGITAYEGLLAINWEDACVGYTADQRIGAVIWNQEGGETISDFHTTSWEARDQTQFRFRSTSRFDTRLVEEVVGEAKRESRRDNGKITFEKPEEREIDLDKNVLFPSEYLSQVIQAGLNGQNNFRADLVDGSAETEIFDAVTFIGAPKKLTGGELEVPGAKLLEGLTYWNVQMGYHDPDSQDSLPDVTVGMRLFENGVATDLLLDYGDLVLRGRLKELKAIEGAGC